MKVVLVSRGKLRHLWFADALKNAGLLEKHFIQQHITQTEKIAGNSDLMQKYFNMVSKYEKKYFGFSGNTISSSFSNFDNLCSELDKLPQVIIIIFGTSFIKGGSIRFLESRLAMNIHAGVSPEYRGSACNFWALYDNCPELVGVSLHRLTDKVDEGDVYFSFFFNKIECSRYSLTEYSMFELKRGLIGVLDFLVSRQIFNQTNAKQMELTVQNMKGRQNIRRSRHKDFNEKILLEFCNFWSLNL